MHRQLPPLVIAFSAALAFALLTACGGGGSSIGGSGSIPNGSVGGTGSTGSGGTGSGGTGSGGTGTGGVPTATPAPPAPNAQLLGSLQLVTSTNISGGYQYAPVAAGSQIVFSCGCSAQAGTSSVGANGSYTVTQGQPALPPSPNLTYTIVPGRNYLVVATAPNHSEAWTLQFLGNSPATNVSLGQNNASDIYTAAGALYVYDFAPTADDTAFDDWNVNAVQAWTNQLRVSPNSAEQTLLNDIATAQENGTTLYPDPPGWSPSAASNASIRHDLSAVAASGDTALPTPCPVTLSGPACTGAPSP